MSGRSNNNNDNNKHGMDTLISIHGKKLKVGETIKFTLVKGKTYKNCKDPVVSAKKKQQPPKENFPMILKFSESVVTPQFTVLPWKKGRLYQQDVPKAAPDSDEDESSTDPNKLKKKRWRKRQDIPKRQFILQEETDFIETIIAKKQKKDLPANRISSRYEGMVEHNPSHYVIMKVSKTNNNSNHDDEDNGNNHGHQTIDVIPLPTNPVHAFQQPAKLKTLSMTEAEHAIEDQRAKVTRYMMHAKGGNKQSAFLMGGAGGPPVSQTRSRLLGKLTSAAQKMDGGIAEEDDDVMGDVGFKSRKGTGAKARKELLSSLADGVTVDDDGVMGGANDSEFGGRRQRFNKLNIDNAAASNNDQQGGGPSSSGKGGGGSSGNDGMAMADDFYQRDVKAEYDELDYDANEQFDDDDVDLGESEVIVDNDGFAADDEDDDDDDDLDDRDGDGGIDGVEGLASIAGFRKLLAKARGEENTSITAAQQQQQQPGADDNSGSATAATSASLPDGVTKMNIDNDEKKKKDELSTDNTTKQLQDTTTKMETSGDGELEDKTITDQAKQVQDEMNKRNAMMKEVPILDDNGQRLLTLESVRREIWLHHGSIRMNRLINIFDINKKNKSRLKKFRELIKELCTMKTDPVDGNMLILKQHYSNMG